TVSDGTYTATDDVLILVSASGNSNPTVSITSPANGASFTEGATVTINVAASDLDGTVSLVEFYDGTVKIGEDAMAPYSFDYVAPSIGSHDLTVVATDDGMAQSTSQVVTVTVAEVLSCSETSNEAQQGAFSIGYEATFTTVGSNVTVTCEVWDTDKVGVVAYLWQQTPFSETQMDNVGGLAFSKTIGGQTAGTTITYACKFAYAGGLSVTKYISYVVGDSCSGSGEDTEAPLDFTAAIGTITSSSIELLLNGTDNSGSVIYDVDYGVGTASTTGASGVQKSLVINNLTPETEYTFSIDASDLTGNTAANNSIVLTASTTFDASTECIGTSSVAQQGAFSVGYNYSFETNGTDVTVSFELLDTDKVGVVAYLWREAPFAETPMDNDGGLAFSKTITG